MVLLACDAAAGDREYSLEQRVVAADRTSGVPVAGQSVQTMCSEPSLLSTFCGMVKVRLLFKLPSLSAIGKRSGARPLAAVVSPVLVNDTLIGP